MAQLPAAHALRISDGGLELREYWTLHDAPDLDDPPEALAGRYRELLLDAVGIRLRRASAPAFTLSGGMDSSSVLASSVHLTGRRQQAFSTVYAGSEFDESEEIASMLDSAVEAWNPVRVDDPDVFGLVERMIDAHDEPVATATWLSHFVLCEQVAGRRLRHDLRRARRRRAERRRVRVLPLSASPTCAWQVRRSALRPRGRGLGPPPRPPDLPQGPGGDGGGPREGRGPRPAGPDPARPAPASSATAHAIEPGLIDLAGYEPVMDTPFRSYLKNRT